MRLIILWVALLLFCGRSTASDIELVSIFSISVDGEISHGTSN